MSPNLEIGCEPDPSFSGTFLKEYDGKCVRLESTNNLNHFITPEGDSLVIKEYGASGLDLHENFNVVASLSGAPGTVSLQSQQSPDSYLTNVEGNIQLKSVPKAIFATWLVAGGLAGGDNTFSINSVHGVLRHDGLTIIETPVDTDESEEFRFDSSFIVRECSEPITTTTTTTTTTTPPVVPIATYRLSMKLCSDKKRKDKVAYKANAGDKKMYVELHATSHQFTSSGKACQKWTAQSPHSHKYTPDAYPNHDLGDHNYCRNPSDHSGSV